MFPAFGYGLEPHVTTLCQQGETSDRTQSKVATFHSKDVKLQLDVAVQRGEDKKGCPAITFKKAMRNGMVGEGLVARVELHEGESISFVLRNDIPDHITGYISTLVLDSQQHDTQSFWQNFIKQSKYKGRWREVVARSLMILKMLTYGKLLESRSVTVLLKLTGIQNRPEQSWLRQRSPSPKISAA